MPRRSPDAGPAWSVSRSNLLDSCRRAAYLETASTSEAHEMPHGIPLRTVVGSAVHEAIAAQMTRWKAGDPISPDEAQASARVFISTVWGARRTRITECLNGVELADNLYHELLSSAHSQLRNFFRMIWPQFSGHSYVVHEFRDRFSLDGTNVWVQVDLVTRNPRNHLVISDWKTGWTSHRSSEAFQMSVYALWAHLRYALPLDDLHTQVVNLRTGEIVRGVPSQALLDETRARIESESSLLRRADDPSSFPPSPESQKCVACNFLPMCSAGMELLRQQP